MNGKRILIISIIMLLSLSVYASAFGISPPRIEKYVLAGTMLNETININNIGSDMLTLQAIVEGEAKEWVVHQPEVNIPGSSDKFFVPIRLSIPKDAPLGTYTAAIRYLVITTEESEDPLTIDTAFSLPITIIVTDQRIVDYAIRNVRTQQQNNTFMLSFTVFNKGNSPLQTDRILVKILDNFQSSVLAQYEVGMKSVAAFTNEEVRVALPSALAPGFYWSNVSVYGADGHYQELVLLEVPEQPQEKRPLSEVAQVKAGSGYMMVGLVLVVMAYFLIHQGKKQRKKKKKRKKKKGLK